MTATNPPCGWSLLTACLCAAGCLLWLPAVIWAGRITTDQGSALTAAAAGGAIILTGLSSWLIGVAIKDRQDMARLSPLAARISPAEQRMLAAREIESWLYRGAANLFLAAALVSLYLAQRYPTGSVALFLRTHQLTLYSFLVTTIVLFSVNNLREWMFRRRYRRWVLQRSGGGQSC